LKELFIKPGSAQGRSSLTRTGLSIVPPSRDGANKGTSTPDSAPWENMEAFPSSKGSFAQ